MDSREGQVPSPDVGEIGPVGVDDPTRVPEVDRSDLEVPHPASQPRGVQQLTAKVLPRRLRQGVKLAEHARRGQALRSGAPQALVDLLATHVAAHRPGDDPRRWLFEGQEGNPPHQNTIGYYWRKACTQAGVEGVTLHDLRHFYASGLIAAGCDVVTVQRALGHSKATTALNTYAHLWPSAEDRTRAAATAMMAQASAVADCLRTGTAPMHR